MNKVLVASEDRSAYYGVQEGFPGGAKITKAPSVGEFRTFLNCSHHGTKNRCEYLFVDLDFLREATPSRNTDDYADAVQKLWERVPGAEVIVICPQERTRAAVMAVKGGAGDYLTYPVDPQEVRHVVDSLKEKVRRQMELNYLREDRWKTEVEGVSRTESQLMVKVFQQVRSVAPTRSTVLLQGETGTGKGVLARLIHSCSNRADGPFISVNCGAIPDTLAESELFGHERGAFTGANRRKLGKFEIAEGGTIVLDEVGTISPSAQIRLLQVLQERTFCRVGGETTIDADVRVIASTNENLADLINRGAFRSDLYYRLNVFPIKLPPLRQRSEDIPILVGEFLKRLDQAYGKKIHGIDATVMEAFQKYTWPGNIRELENIIERAYILENSRILTPECFPAELFAFPTLVASADGNGLPSLHEARRRSLEMMERQYLREILTLYRGRVDKSADTAGITPRQLYNLMVKYGFRKEDFK
ncbi:MAG: sigma-54 dependent transcriptional regulator [Pseudomonadota bacterium]